MKASLSATQLLIIFLLTLLVAFAFGTGVIVSAPAGDDENAVHKGYFFHKSTKHYMNSILHAIIIAVVVILIVYFVTVYMDSYEQGFDRSHYGIGRYGKMGHEHLHDMHHPLKTGEFGQHKMPQPFSFPPPQNHMTTQLSSFAPHPVHPSHNFGSLSTPNFAPLPPSGSLTTNI